MHSRACFCTDKDEAYTLTHSSVLIELAPHDHGWPLSYTGRRNGHVSVAVHISMVQAGVALGHGMAHSGEMDPFPPGWLTLSGCHEGANTRAISCFLFSSVCP